jgi:hypothetical protein
MEGEQLFSIFSDARTVASQSITSGSSASANVSMATNFASAIALNKHPGCRQLSLWSS